MMHLLQLIAQSSDAPLFVRPLPVWDFWAWLLIPLTVAVAVVYKSIKCRKMEQVPREALVLAAWILVVMVAGGAVLAGIVFTLER
jgi:hypothetical protein